jgi:hypothetical protein
LDGRVRRGICGSAICNTLEMALPEGMISRSWFGHLEAENELIGCRLSAKPDLGTDKGIWVQFPDYINAVDLDVLDVLLIQVVVSGGP